MIIKKFFVFTILMLAICLPACQETYVITHEEKLHLTEKTAVQIDFEFTTAPFEVVTLDHKSSIDESSLRSGNTINIENKGLQVKPHISIGADNLNTSLLTCIVGNETLDYLRAKPIEEYKVVYKDDHTQSIQIKLGKILNSILKFKTKQYGLMSLTGLFDEHQNTQNFNQANEQICLVQENELNKRQIPFMTDYVQFELSEGHKDGTETIYQRAKLRANFKPRGCLLAISLKNATGKDIVLKGIKLLSPQPWAYSIKHRFGAVEHSSYPDADLNKSEYNLKEHSYVPKFSLAESKQDFEYPIYADADTRTFAKLGADATTDGQFYIWGYPLNGKEDSFLLIQFKYSTMDKLNEELYSTTLKIDPKLKGKKWKSGFAYRSKLTIKEDKELSPSVRTLRYPEEEILEVGAWTKEPGFTIGNWGDPNSSTNSPIRRVLFNKFYMGKYEVTNEQYAKFLNENGGNQVVNGLQYIKLDASGVQISKNSAGKYVPVLGKEKHPVVFVSWEGAKAFCKWVGGRLPSEAEWEYAAKGGPKKNRQIDFFYAGGKDLYSLAWFWNNANQNTHTVGGKRANELGLHDMSGNVWEWCADRWHSNYIGISGNKEGNIPWVDGDSANRVVRGGSVLSRDFKDYEVNHRFFYSTDANSISTTAYKGDCGFRVVWDQKPTE